MILVSFLLLSTILFSTPLVFGDAKDAHNIATNYMVSQSQAGGASSGTSEDISIVFSAVDGEKLVVGISADVLSQNITYTEGDVQEFLGIDTPIEIKYMSFTLDSSTLDITSENKVLEKLRSYHQVDNMTTVDLCLENSIDPMVQLGIFVPWENVVTALNIREP